MIKVLSAALDKDLSELTQQLWRLKITHRVLFRNEQELWIESDHQLEFVQQLCSHWQEHGTFPQDIEAQHHTSSADNGQSLPVSAKTRSVNLKNIPVVIIVLTLSVALSLWTDFGAKLQLLKFFTITDFEYLNNQVNYYSLAQNFSSLELWRFISPIFIHFNLPHILFNGLWIWVVGAAIEQRQHSYVLVFIVLLSAVISNIAQYYVSGPVFGGLSGVVYAIISYAWLWDKRHSRKLGVVSNALMGFMLAWLALGYSGLLTQLGLGSIANTAHLAGLLSGLFAMYCIQYYNKIFLNGGL